MSGRGRELIEYLQSAGLLQVGALMCGRRSISSGIRGDGASLSQHHSFILVNKSSSVPYCVPGTDTLALDRRANKIKSLPSGSSHSSRQRQTVKSNTWQVGQW